MISLRQKLTILVLALFVVGNAWAAGESDGPSFLRQNQVGLRLGAWVNQGDRPPDSGDLDIEGSNDGGSFTTNIKDNAFYAEFFYAYRLSRQVMLELAAGTTNRGSVTLANDNGSDVGNLTIYPITAQARLYPFTGPMLGVYPYLSGGAGIYIGRRTVQFTNSGTFYSNWEEESGFDFTYAVGGGFDWPIASSIGLDVAAKYMPVNFSKSLLTVDDYQAFTITLGIKYLYLK
jgi:outer membrane protein W